MGIDFSQNELDAAAAHQMPRETAAPVTLSLPLSFPANLPGIAPGTLPETFRQRIPYQGAWPGAIPDTSSAGTRQDLQGNAHQQTRTGTDLEALVSRR